MITKKSFSHFILMVAVLLITLTVIGTSLVVAEEAEQGSKFVVPIQSTATSCTEFLKRNESSDIRDCGVSESGTFGSVDDQTYYYVLYCLISVYSSETEKCDDGKYHGKMGLSIIVHGASNQEKLLMERVTRDIGLYIYEKPMIVKNSFGMLMYVPIRSDGTGFGNDSEYYVWSLEQREWKLIDSRSWIKDLRAQLPPKLSILKGIWPDIQAMTAEAGLYRDGDANCCPSGGTAFIELSLKDDRFSIKSVEFRQDDNK